VRRAGLSLAIVALTLAAAAPSLAATAGAVHRRSTDRYVLGAAVIAVVSVALLVQLIVWGRRARRRPGGPPR
jgi:hypothetical protein